MATLWPLVVSFQSGLGNLIDIATQGPIPALLLILGALLLAVSIGIFGGLSLPALATWLNPMSGPTTRRPPGE